MNLFFTIKIYLILAVFWGFVPQALLAGQLPAALVQVLCIGAVIIATWRILSYRSFRFDSRIGLSFVAYVASTAATNIVFWFLQRGVR